MRIPDKNTDIVIAPWSSASLTSLMLNISVMGLMLWSVQKWTMSLIVPGSSLGTGRD